MASTFIVIMIYSSGMPILYIIGTLFFLVTYWNEKWLLIKFYKRTENNLNKDLPLYTVGLLRYILLAKIIIGITMFTDPTIFQTVTQPDPSSVPLKIDVKKWLLESNSVSEETKDLIRNDQYEIINRFNEMHQQIYLGFIFFFVCMIAGGQILFVTVIGVINGIKNFGQ
jgi:hypothetical protein